MCFYCTEQRIFNMNEACVEFCRLVYTHVTHSCLGHLVVQQGSIRTAWPVFEREGGSRGHALEKALHFFTSWITSSSSITWSLPTFCGLCLTDEPQTRALKKEEYKFSRRGSWRQKKAATAA